MAKPTEKQIQACRKIGMSDEEIAEMYADDEDIDHGKRMSFDLSPEEEKKAKKYANAGTRKVTKTERKPKENPTKEGVITEIFNFLTEKGYTEVKITNKTREILFNIGEDVYQINLIAKRKPKGG